MSAPAVRFPFRPDRVEALVDFAAAHALSPFSGAPVYRLLTTLTPPEGVIIIGWRRRTALVVAVVDRCANLHDAALFEVLGWSRQAPADALLDVAVPLAEAVGRTAGRAVLRMSLPVGLPGWDPVAGGWEPADKSYTLERPAGPWEATPLPVGARWEDLTPEGVDEHYALLEAVVAEDPEMVLPNREAYAASLLGAELPVRVLRKDGVEIGFARAGLGKAGVGEVLTVGRAPAWRGRGLGPVVLGEALRVLHAHGVTTLRLGVSGANRPALALYEKTGFVEREAWQAWHRPLRSGA